MSFGGAQCIRRSLYCFWLYLLLPMPVACQPKVGVEVEIDNLEKILASVEKIRETADIQSTQWRKFAEDTVQRSERVSKELARHLDTSIKDALGLTSRMANCTTEHANDLIRRDLEDLLNFFKKNEPNNQERKIPPHLPYICSTVREIVDAADPKQISVIGWRFNGSAKARVQVYTSDGIYNVPEEAFGVQGDKSFVVNVEYDAVRDRLYRASKIVITWENGFSAYPLPIFVRRPQDSCVEQYVIGEGCRRCELRTNDRLEASARNAGYLLLRCERMRKGTKYTATAKTISAMDTNKRGVVLMTNTDRCGSHAANCSEGPGPATSWSNEGIVDAEGVGIAEIGIDAWGDPDAKVSFPPSFELQIEAQQ